MNFIVIQLAETNIGTIGTQFIEHLPAVGAETLNILSTQSADIPKFELGKAAMINNSCYEKLFYIHQVEKKILISNKILTNYSNKRFYPYLPFI